MSREGELVLGFCGNFNHWVASWFGEIHLEVEWEKRSQELLEGRNPDQWHPSPRPDVSGHKVLSVPRGAALCMPCLEADSNAVGFKGLHITLPRGKYIIDLEAQG